MNNLNELSTVTRNGTLTVAGTTTSQATNVTVNASNQARMKNRLAYFIALKLFCRICQSFRPLTFAMAVFWMSASLAFLVARATLWKMPK